MFTSSVINTAAAGSSSSTHYRHPQHQHLRESSYSLDVFSDHNQANLVLGMGAQDANDFQVPNESTITLVTPFGNNTPMDMPGSVPRAHKKKSDNRSKIRTAQGLRDRRVRLSIGIAKKFFDLQDLLGFDKPSKTVDWLLTKSNKAILKLSAASSSSISSEAAGTEDGFKSPSSRSTATCSTNHKVSSDNSLKAMQQKAGFSARESRERARARARARTAAKLCTSKLHHQNLSLLKIPGDNNNDDQQTSCLSLNCNKFRTPLLKTSYAERLEEKGKGEEQPKLKQPLQLHSYGPNPNPNLSLDWDISSAIPRPSSSATQRLNLSRVVEIYTRLNWDQLLNDYRSTL